MRRVLAALRAVFAAGRGRPMALAWLAVLSVLVLWPKFSPFHGGQAELFDRYQKVFPRTRATAPVVMVEVDEASLKALGQWPWPRDRLAMLIDNIAAQRPAVIGLDMYFPEADGSSPEAVAARLPASAARAREALMTLPSQDAVFAQSIARAGVVLGAAGMDMESPTTRTVLRHAPVLVSGGEALSAVRHHPFVLASLPALQGAAGGQAILSVDLQGGVVRRVPLVVAVGSDLVPSFALELLRVAAGVPAVGLEVGAGGVRAATVADVRVPTLPTGEAWLHAGHADAARYVSAQDVLAGRVPADAFTDKVVMVGLTGMGLNDMRITALGEQVPGLEIQAQVVESILEGSLLERPFWMVFVEAASLLVLGLFLIWAVPNLQPRIATMLTLVLYVLLFGAGFLVLRLSGFLFDAATPFASLNVVFGSLLGSVFIETDRHKRQAQAGLQRAREDAARVAGELDAARRIQLASLPDPRALLAHETRFELAARLESAREVGGDLYDFFWVDNKNLFFVVGDVSGKGLPASLFMAVTRALAKSVALRGPASVAQIVTDTNRELSRDNPELLFVTLVAGVLAADTGYVQLCNAGHDAPRLIAPGKVSRISGPGGPPLGMLETFDYPLIELQLQPGEGLCLLTDGVTEAMNVAGRYFGGERADAALGRAGKSASEALDVLREAVREFVGEAEATDDLTLLVLRWPGHAYGVPLSCAGSSPNGVGRI